MERLFAVTAALALLGFSIAASAAITIDTITVGNPGNAGELSGSGAGGDGPDRICGSVSYTYNIGKYEVTAGQYTAFLTGVAKTDTYGLYSTSMDTAFSSYGCNIKRSGSSGSYTYSVASDWANRPVNYVSYWDSCRFANWLHNGQPTGLQTAATTERGAYTLDGYNGIDGGNICRNTGAKWAVASEDEWYKAAYYKGGGTDASYWDYPTQSNTAPSNVGADGYTDPGNHANYYNNGYTIGSPYYRTNVGEFENSASAYGTFDQGGNVWEWNEALMSLAARGLRGGSFHGYGNTGNTLLPWDRAGNGPTGEFHNVGSRVASIPEPASIITLLGGLILLLGIRRRRA